MNYEAGLDVLGARPVVVGEHEPQRTFIGGILIGLVLGMVTQNMMLAWTKVRR